MQQTVPQLTLNSRPGRRSSILLIRNRFIRATRGSSSLGLGRARPSGPSGRAGSVRRDGGWGRSPGPPAPSRAGSREGTEVRVPTSSSPPAASDDPQRGDGRDFGPAEEPEGQGGHRGVGLVHVLVVEPTGRIARPSGLGERRPGTGRRSSGRLQTVGGRQLDANPPAVPTPQEGVERMPGPKPLPPLRSRPPRRVDRVPGREACPGPAIVSRRMRRRGWSRNALNFALLALLPGLSPGLLAGSHDWFPRDRSLGPGRSRSRRGRPACWSRRRGDSVFEYAGSNVEGCADHRFRQAPVFRVSPSQPQRHEREALDASPLADVSSASGVASASRPSRGPSCRLLREGMLATRVRQPGLENLEQGVGDRYPAWADRGVFRRFSASRSGSSARRAGRPRP